MQIEAMRPAPTAGSIASAPGHATPRSATTAEIIRRPAACEIATTDKTWRERVCKAPR